MTIQVQNQSAQTNAILDAITYIKGNQCDSFQCYLLTKPPIILNWSHAYQIDLNTSYIFFHLQSTQKKLTASDLATIHTSYITSLKERRIQIIKKNWFSSNLFWIMPNNYPS